MSDWLVKMQDAVANYPPWLVVGVGLIVAAGICMLLAKVLRVVAVIILVGGVAAAGWLAWRAYGPGSEPAVSSQPSVHSSFGHVETDLASPNAPAAT